MKKNFMYWILALLCVGFVACSGEESNLNEEGGPDEGGMDIPVSSFYVVNEGWFGYDMGSVNVFNTDGTIEYNVYKTANPNEELGNTTQFATIWKGNIYFVSKQGNRLVVADAQTFKKKGVFTELGGDGRSFVGVSAELGYIGHSNGIRRFNIANLELGDPVEGVSGQIGSLCYAGGHLFAVSAQKVYIIDVTTNTVVDTLIGTFSTLTQSKDGLLWIANSDGFIKLNPATLKQEKVAYPQGTSISGSWGAWNAGSLCASTLRNILYWTSGHKIIQYNIDTNTANTDFYKLGKDKEGKQMVFYGAAVRVDPVSDKLVLIIVREGWGDSYAHNWVHIVKTNGELEKEIIVKAGGGTDNELAYWFPALPLFKTKIK